MLSVIVESRAHTPGRTRHAPAHLLQPRHGVDTMRMLPPPWLGTTHTPRLRPHVHLAWSHVNTHAQHRAPPSRISTEVRLLRQSWASAAPQSPLCSAATARPVHVRASFIQAQPPTDNIIMMRSAATWREWNSRHCAKCVCVCGGSSSNTRHAARRGAQPAHPNTATGEGSRASVWNRVAVYDRGTLTPPPKPSPKCCASMRHGPAQVRSGARCWWCAVTWRHRQLPSSGDSTGARAAYLDGLGGLAFDLMRHGGGLVHLGTPTHAHCAPYPKRGNAAERERERESERERERALQLCSAGWRLGARLPGGECVWQIHRMVASCGVCVCVCALNDQWWSVTRGDRRHSLNGGHVMVNPQTVPNKHVMQQMSLNFFLIIIYFIKTHRDAALLETHTHTQRCVLLCIYVVLIISDRQHFLNNNSNQYYRSKHKYNNMKYGCRSGFI